MPERIGAPLFLLARFSEYFEEVAGIKLAIAEGRLGALLASGDEAPPSEPADLAARVSARLAAALIAQRKDIARSGTQGEIDMHEKALYAMAALSDELFILELEWPGREAWMDTLLEYRLFRTRNAGVRFFTMASELIESRIRDPLEADLAAVMVLALRLGFKGQYRGAQGEGQLHALRAKLFAIAEREHGDRASGPAFPQALTQLQESGMPARFAPLTPWFMGALIVLAVYLVISSALWLTLLEPFRKTVGSG